MIAAVQFAGEDTVLLDLVTAATVPSVVVVDGDGEYYAGEDVVRADVFLAAVVVVAVGDVVFVVVVVVVIDVE